MGGKTQWLESFVTNVKIYCVYVAPNEKAVREHAEKGGFSENKISKVQRVIDPTSSEVSN